MIPSSISIRKSLSPKIQKLVAGYPSVNVFPVAWGEQDSFQHLNNVYHARYFENGRFSHLYQVLQPFLTKKQFIDFKDGKEIGVIMKSIFIQYRSVCTFPDNLVVSTSIGNLKLDRYTQYSLIISQKTEQVVAEAQGVVVTYNHINHSKVNLPQEYIDAFRASEKEFGVQEKFPLPKL